MCCPDRELRSQKIESFWSRSLWKSAAEVKIGLTQIAQLQPLAAVPPPKWNCHQRYFLVNMIPEGKAGAERVFGTGWCILQMVSNMERKIS